MTNRNDGVYPGLTHDGFTNYGLTKRELFAAMAMQGLIQEYAIRGVHPEIAVQQSVVCADLLIAELNKEVQS